MLCCRTYKQEPCQNQCVFCREVRTERMTYHAMMAAKQLNPRKIIMGIQIKIKINLILLSCQERFLNLRANMGISATKRKQDSNMNMKRKKALNFSETKKP